MTDLLLQERRDSALWLTLNRPEVHNALNAALTHALTVALQEASQDEALRAVVLTGAGERSFCAGADLKESAGGMFQSENGANPIANVLRAIESCGKPVVARVNGAALAGGVGLVAACDLAIAADHAKFGLPEVQVGLFPMMVAALLLERIPRRRLQAMAYLGETLSAAEAADCALIDRVAPAAGLDTATEEILTILKRNSPAAMRVGKAALQAMGALAPQDRLAFAERQIAELGKSEDAREGRAAFAEKRRPRWMT